MPNEPTKADRDAARLLMQWCEATGVNEDMLADHFKNHRLSTEAAIVAWLRTHPIIEYKSEVAWDDLADALEQGMHHG